MRAVARRVEARALEVWDYVRAVMGTNDDARARAAVHASADRDLHSR